MLSIQRLRNNEILSKKKIVIFCSIYEQNSKSFSKFIYKLIFRFLYIFCYIILHRDKNKLYKFIMFKSFSTLSFNIEYSIE